MRLSFKNPYVRTDLLSCIRLRQINGLRVMGHPEACCVAVDSVDFNIYRVSDAMAKKGWSLSPLQFPARYNVASCNVNYVDSRLIRFTIF